jgi:RNA polymerase subunit RPABC4/transcription elongation factor Spt4
MDQLHIRAQRMRTCAINEGKFVPTMEQCKELIEKSGMICPACGKEMIYQAPKRIGINDVVSLQHWRNGTVGVLCRGCNVRERANPTDEMVPPDQKFCPSCEEVKPRTEFYKDRGQTRYICKGCFKRRQG